LVNRRRDLATLGVDSVSNLDAHALARAYKRAALKWHPDKPGGDAEKFVAATEAFQRLRAPAFAA
jgi:curved DNA-binding protein CbpA